MPGDNAWKLTNPFQCKKFSTSFIFHANFEATYFDTIVFYSPRQHWLNLSLRTCYIWTKILHSNVIEWAEIAVTVEPSCSRLLDSVPVTLPPTNENLFVNYQTHKLTGVSNNFDNQQCVPNTEFPCITVSHQHISSTTSTLSCFLSVGQSVLTENL